MSEDSSTTTTVVNKVFSILAGYTEFVDMSDVTVAQSVRIDTDVAIIALLTSQDETTSSYSTNQRIDLAGVNVTAIEITAGISDATVYLSMRKAVTV